MTTGNPHTLKGLLGLGRERLAARGVENCDNEAYYLLHKLTGLGREQLMLRGSEMTPPGLAAPYLELVARRLAGEPLQYLLGQWEFYGLPMAVGPGVLIPRPETEELVERVLGFLKGTPSPALLDLCSGSGCIPIAIANNCPDGKVWGVELSPQAYSYFCQNIAINSAKNVTPVLSDVFALPVHITAQRYHAVTANPPYITTEAMDSLQREVLREPTMALCGGGDGLDFYRALPGIAMELLYPGGLLAMEIGEEQGASVTALTAAAGFTQVTLHQDLSHNDRIVTGIVPSYV